MKIDRFSSPSKTIFTSFVYAIMLLAVSPDTGLAATAFGIPQSGCSQTVISVQALRNLPAPPNNSGELQIVADGFAKQIDGGGGLFIWSAKDVANDDGGIIVNPVGHAGPGRWVRILAEPGMVSPLYYGARCDGVDDDSPSINDAINYIRAQHSYGDMAPMTGILRLPAEQCVLKASVNATKLASASVTIEGTGGSLVCEVVGQPCIDAMGSGRLELRDVTIYGDEKSMPSVGLQIGRIAPRASAAGMYLDHVTISGYFSFAAFYNFSAETQLDTKLNASNQAPDGYGAVWDGFNHWNVTSAFVRITTPVDQPESFNDNTCISCRITSNGPGGIPMWAEGTAELTFVNSYISNFDSGVGAVLYNNNVNLNFDAHFEAWRLSSVFLLAGRSHPVVYGLTYREHDFFGQISLFALGKGVKSATLEDVDLNIGRIHTHGTWFDDPARYTVSGRVAGVYSDGWVMPGGGFSGMACFGAKCSFSQ